MRVLYVDHTGLVSGGQHSLLELVSGLPAGIQPLLACPEGPLSARARGLGIPMIPIPATEGSLRLHPVHTPRALVEVATMARAVRGHAARRGVDLVHANGIRAGLIAMTCGAPLVVHLRDVLPPTAVSRSAMAAVSLRAAALIAISEFVADRALVPRRQLRKVRTIANGVDVRRFSGPRPQRAAGPVLGVVGQITPWKAQDDAIRALALVRRTHPGATLVIAGEAKFVSAATRYDNRAFEERLHALAAELDVAEAVDFAGEVDDVPSLLRTLDILLLPSWQEPFGRAVIEAMAAGTPVVATAEGGPAAVLAGEAGGVVCPPRDPERWADCITSLLDDPARVDRMVRRGKARVRDAFSRETHVASIVSLYRELLSLDPTAAPEPGPRQTKSSADERPR